VNAKLLATRVLIAAAVGAAVWFAAGAGIGGNGVAPHASCFSALRLLRHAVATFEAQHGALPGAVGGAPATAEQLTGQLTLPRDLRGSPSPSGPLAGLLDGIPENPFTGDSSLVIVPPGADAIAFAAATPCGWAYLAEPGRDASGPLPAGLVLPCGASGPTGPGRGIASVQEIAFEIEDFERWR
jgi:hypothetical protein